MTGITIPEDRAEREQLQRDLCARYQAALARAGGDPTGVDRAGKDALAGVLTSVDRLLWKIINEKVSNRFGGIYRPEVGDECHADLIPVVITAAATFDPDRCPAFGSWLGRRGGELRAVLRDCLDRARGIEHLREIEKNALRISWRSEAELRDKLHRDPSLDEIRAEMESYCYRDQYDRLPPGLPDTERRAAAKAKLSKSGMLKAIRDLHVLRELIIDPLTPDSGDGGGWDTLDVPAEETPGSATGDGTDALARLMYADLPANVRAAVTSRAADAGRPEGTYAALTEEHLVTAADIKSALRDIENRTQAAHAHYAYLAGDLDAQFDDDAPTGPPTGVAALLARARVSGTPQPA